MKIEFEQGKNIADAAVKTSTLKHFIWSTLPNATKISKGKYLVPHFEAKNRVDEYIKGQRSSVRQDNFPMAYLLCAKLLVPNVYTKLCCE